MLYRQTISYREVLVQMSVGKIDAQYDRVTVVGTTNASVPGMLLGRIITKTWVNYSSNMYTYVQCAHCIVAFYTFDEVKGCAKATHRCSVFVQVVGRKHGFSSIIKLHE